MSQAYGKIVIGDPMDAAESALLTPEAPAIVVEPSRQVFLFCYE